MVTRRDVLKTIGVSAIIPSGITEANISSNESTQKERTILYGPAKIMYKVVTLEENGNYYSSNMRKYKAEYKVGEWTYPIISDSKLFVFKALEDAFSFSFRDDHRFFECEVGEVFAMPYCVVQLNKIDAIPTKSLEKYWKGGQQDYQLSGDYLMEVPFEAYLTDKVKLTKEIFK